MCDRAVAPLAPLASEGSTVTIWAAMSGWGGERSSRRRRNLVVARGDRMELRRGGGWMGDHRRDYIDAARLPLSSALHVIVFARVNSKAGGSRD